MKTRSEEINERLLEIQAEIEKRNDLKAEDFSAFEKEIKELTEERAALLKAQEQRKKLLEDLANGNEEGQTISRGNVIFANNGYQSEQEERTEHDPYDTIQYRKAFMEFVCRGTEMPLEFRTMPIEYRADATTTTEDAGAVIPTTILNEIIKKAESYGNIFSRIRRLNIQGGVKVPILSLKPTAHWIDEDTTSDTQKLEANTSVSFSFFGLECRIAQTLLVRVTTLAEFQRLFVPLATEAIIKAIEIGVFRGTGVGSMLGVLNEPRIPARNKIIMTSSEFGSWQSWKKKVFGKMKKAYRNGVFIMAQGTFDGYIDGMVDTRATYRACKLRY